MHFMNIGFSPTLNKLNLRFFAKIEKDALGASSGPSSFFELEIRAPKNRNLCFLFWSGALTIIEQKFRLKWTHLTSKMRVGLNWL